MFDLLPQQMQPAVLPVPEAQPDIVYVGGSQAPNPPKPPPSLVEVEMTGSQLPSQPKPPTK
jgi:hypothetical protein